MPISSGSFERHVAGTYLVVVPAGVYWMWASGIGGGGGGGSNTKFSFQGAGTAGGAGESVQNFMFAVTPGDTITVIVGAGGSKGHATAQATNIVTGPEGNGGSAGAVSYGFGGGKTYIGPIVLCGGYGGERGSIAGGTAGMGGGWNASTRSTDNGGLSNAGQRIITGFPGQGFSAVRKDGNGFWPGSGGGCGSADITTPNGADGGPCGAFPGGIGGTGTGASNGHFGGGGGGASPYGPGGNGGNESQDAPAVPAGSYGAGAGSCGGNATYTGGLNTQDAFLGADGADGCALLTWIQVT